MASVRFFLANPKILRTSINAIVLVNGTRYKKGIGVSIDTKYWNTSSQRASVTQKYRDGTAINFEIERYRTAIDRLIYNITERSINIANSAYFWMLVDCEINGLPYVNHVSNTTYFCEYFEKIFIPKFYDTKTHSRIIRFEITLAKVRNYEQETKRHLTFSDINIDFHRDFQAYMSRKKHSVNYFGTQIKIIKQVMREARDVDKMHSNDEFLNSAFKSPSLEVDTVYLTTDELHLIQRTMIDDNFIDALYPRSVNYGRESLRQSYTIAKNRFLIGAFTGLRMSDFNKVSPDHISNGKITIIAQKTKQRIVIPIHPIVQTIIDSGFDFSQSLSEQKTRRYIKDICKVAGINESVEIRSSTSDRSSTIRKPKYALVSSHTARRSFATNAYKAGIPSISIMKITGHTSERTFMKYIRISSEENADILSGHEFFK